MTREPVRLRGQRGGLPWPLGLLLFVLLLFSAIIALLLFTPAAAIGMLLDRSGQDARLLAPAGRVHSGSAQLLITQNDLGRLRWALDGPTLMRGRLGYRLELEAPGHALQARIRLGLRSVTIDGIEGHLDEAGLRALLAPYDILPSGHLTLSSGRFELTGDRLTAVHGDAHWTGGFVRYVLADQGWTVDFPPLDAALRLEADEPLLEVFDPEGRELLDARLDANGWAHLRIRYRFIAMAGFPWPDPPEPDTVLIELSEQVF